MQGQRPTFRDVAFLQAMFESLPYAAIAVGTDGNVHSFNPAAARLLSKRPEPGAARRLDSLLRLVDGATGAPIARPFQYLLGEAPRGRAGKYDVIVPADGRGVPIEHSANPIRSDTGAIIGVLFVFRDASRTRDLVRRLNMRSTYDRLTRLLNRAEFERRLSRAIENVRPGNTHTLLYMDLDGFKSVNDTAGHGVGDAVLRDVARFLRERLRGHDALARLGGDEFGVLLESCPPEKAAALTQALANALEARELRVGEKRFRVGVSIGLTPIVDRRRGVREVLADADRACYAAKRTRESMRVLRTPSLPAPAPLLLHA